MLEIENLHVKVSGKEILKGIDLSVQPGQVHAIMGPNGSGKTTLAQVLAGRITYEVTQGKVRFEGKDLLIMRPAKREASTERESPKRKDRGQRSEAGRPLDV